MKVIDLLNKIANGEEVPNKITIGNSPFELTLSSDGKYYSGNTDSVLNNVLGMNKLNDEVEIIEEDKKIEKLATNLWCDEDKTCKREMNEKINEIIDYLEENK